MELITESDWNLRRMNIFEALILPLIDELLS